MPVMPASSSAAGAKRGMRRIGFFLRAWWSHRIEPEIEGPIMEWQWAADAVPQPVIPDEHRRCESRDPRLPCEWVPDRLATLGVRDDTGGRGACLANSGGAL